MRAASKIVVSVALFFGAVAAHGRLGLSSDSTSHMPLDGSAKCADCHQDQHHSQKLSACDNCHRMSRWETECSACHSSRDLQSSTFTAKDHDFFPLEGRHAAVPCAECHAGRGESVGHVVENKNCDGCHTARHQAEFSGFLQGAKCKSCHTPNGFAPSTFTVDRHRETRFPLSGAHRAVYCRECHTDSPEEVSSRRISFHFQEIACSGCHADPHAGEFAQKMQGRSCDACHISRTWKDTPGFDHSATAFALEGAHRALACVRCHEGSRPVAGSNDVTFGSAPVRCSECHQDIHGGQFLARMSSADCGQCHQPARWKPTIFRHQIDSNYPLQGVHARVACAQCHTLTKEIGGTEIVFYKGTPRQCEACHASDLRVQ
jgi:hypothetical protein